MGDRRGALLVFKDGSVFRGERFGAEGVTQGEVVFNTSHTGYQEIMTDPSYNGQIVLMTHPHIGNYGINPDDDESRAIFARGMIIRSPSLISSSWRSEISLDEWLIERKIVAICRVDTRALTIKIRDHGASPALIASEGLLSEGELIERARKARSTEGIDLVGSVSTEKIYNWSEVTPPLTGSSPIAPSARSRPKIVAFDFGIKRSILRAFADRGARVTVVPYKTSVEQIDRIAPDGIFLSNGPGDPEPLTESIRSIESLIGRYPIFGICLGHQLLAMALGARSYKLKFGHHGANHPALELASGKVSITSQNHNYAIDSASLPKEARVTHINLNDETVEGFESKKLKLFAVQYHPEAGPGPHEERFLFDRFIELIDARRAGK